MQPVKQPQVEISDFAEFPKCAHVTRRIDMPLQFCSDLARCSGFQNLILVGANSAITGAESRHLLQGLAVMDIPSAIELMSLRNIGVCARRRISEKLAYMRKALLVLNAPDGGFSREVLFQICTFCRYYDLRSLIILNGKRALIEGLQCAKYGSSLIFEIARESKAHFLSLVKQGRVLKFQVPVVREIRERPPVK